MQIPLKVPRDIDKSFGTNGFMKSRGVGSRVGSSGTSGLDRTGLGRIAGSDWTWPVSIILAPVSLAFGLITVFSTIVGACIGILFLKKKARFIS